jgi:peptide/nickel transport system ATP-binding protein
MALLQIDDLTIEYVTTRGIVQAVNGVTFGLNEGENLGLVGESGCGKTTIAKSLLRILPPNARIAKGHIYFQDSDIVSINEEQLKEIRWKKISTIPQSAMNALDPVCKIEDQIVEIAMKRGGLRRHEALKKAVDLFQLVGLDKNRLRDYPHQFSGGMRQRVAIAMALALNPVIIIADEPTTALDVIVQDEVLQSIYELQKRLKTSMILITHDISIVAEGCDKIAIMYAGKLMEYGETKAVFRSPCNPYTMGLQNAFPSVKGPKKDLISIPGSPPNLIGLLKGCRFSSRCPFSLPLCAEVDPPLVKIDHSHFAACHLVEKAEELGRQAILKETWDRIKKKESRMLGATR